MLKAFHDKVAWSVECAVRALVEADKSKAEEVIDAKDEINRLADEAESHVSRRLTADEPNRMLAFRIESEMVEYLKRVFYFAKRIAMVVSDVDAASAESEPATPQERQTI
ncbi:MAG: PhoU domain-containing protein [Pirellulales bacterium]